MGLLTENSASYARDGLGSGPSSGYFTREEFSSKQSAETLTSADGVASAASSIIQSDKMPDYAASNMQSDNMEATGESVSFTEEPSVVSRDNTKTSTPTKDRLSSLHNLQGTPKSILKRRSIIDRNVHVESKYAHTPSHQSSSGKSRLNFDYSDPFEVEDSFSDLGTSAMTNPSTASDLTRSFKSTGLGTSDSKGYSEYSHPEQLSSNHTIADLMEQNLLLKNSGNDRRNAAIVNELSARPKAYMFDSTTPLDRTKDSSLLNNRTSSMSSTLRSRSMVDPMACEDRRPFLGYDWIAGVLDNEADALTMDQSDTFFEEMKEFRRVNKDDCEGLRAVDLVVDRTKPIEPQITKPSHTCVHGYTINDRLFPEAMNPNDNGTNVCPVCLAERREPTKEEPGFIRVSIPRSTLVTPYKIKPHRRRSFDETDSYALSRHCLAGWECSQPSKIPTASSMDLKHSALGLQGKLSQSTHEMEKLANQFSRQNRTLGDNLLEKTRKQLNHTKELLSRTQVTDTSNAGLERSLRHPTSEDLLSQAHQFRFSQQRFQKDGEINGGVQGIYTLT